MTKFLDRFIKLTVADMYNSDPHPLYIDPNSIEAITTSRPGSRDVTVIITSGGVNFYAAESQAQVFARIDEVLRREKK